MHPNAQAIIEGLQPYHRGNAYRAHPLSMLHYLDRLSKHRLLHVVAASFGGFFLHPTRSRNWQLAPGAIESYEGIIETDTVVTRIPLQRVDPNVEMYVEIQPAFDVAFAQVPGMQNISVFKTLTDCYNFIIGEVLPPLFPFLS